MDLGIAVKNPFMILVIIKYLLKVKIAIGKYLPIAIFF